MDENPFGRVRLHGHQNPCLQRPRQQPQRLPLLLLLRRALRWPLPLSRLRVRLRHPRQQLRLQRPRNRLRLLRPRRQKRLRKQWKARTQRKRSALRLRQMQSQSRGLIRKSNNLARSASAGGIHGIPEAILRVGWVVNAANGCRGKARRPGKRPWLPRILLFMAIILFITQFPLISPFFILVSPPWPEGWARRNSPSGLQYPCAHRPHPKHHRCPGPSKPSRHT